MQQVITRIKNEMLITFNDVMKWFNISETLMYQAPADGGWNIASILEHIAMTNFYLLILIRKSSTRALQFSRVVDYQEMLRDYAFDWQRIQNISNTNAFSWHRPDHMEPSGNADLVKIKATLKQQLHECMLYLDDLKNGEGVTYKMMMSVNGIGRIDVYHYIYFLVQHAKRHITQMQQIRHEYNNQTLLTNDTMYVVLHG